MIDLFSNQVYYFPPTWAYQNSHPQGQYPGQETDANDTFACTVTSFVLLSRNRWYTYLEKVYFVPPDMILGVLWVRAAGINCCYLKVVLPVLECGMMG